MELTEASGTEWISLEEAARLLTVSAEQLLRRCELNRLALEKIGGTFFVRRHEVALLIPAAAKPEAVTGGTRAVTRRQFLTGAAGALFGSTTHGLFVNFVDRHVLQPVELALERTFGSREELQQLLGLNRAVLSVSFGHMHLGSSSFHKDNVAGGATVYACLADAAEPHLGVVSGPTRGISVDRDGSMLVAGGPLGCDYTRIAFEFEGAGRHLHRRANPHIPLRWYGVADIDHPRARELGRVFYHLEGAGAYSPPNWPLIDTERPGRYWEVALGRRAEDNASGEPAYWLADNYLTITRLPNFLSSHTSGLLQEARPLSQWPQLVVLDGRNGLGTRGAELLAAADGRQTLLDALEAVRGYGSAYQVLFRLTALDNSSGYSRFTRIEFVDAAEIRLTSGMLKSAHAYASRQLASPEQTSRT